METKKLKKEVKFTFENGQTEIIDISSPESLNPADNYMYGCVIQQKHINYPDDTHNTLDPQEWVDDYNDWDIEEGNESKKITGSCTGYIVYIDEEYIREKIEEALKQVANHDWSGWGVALHLHTNMEITISDIISNNTWCESDDFEEILRVRTWNVDYSIEQWADEVRKNQHSENDKKILAEIKKLEAECELDIDNLSELAKEDYENAYQIAFEEDLSTRTEDYINQLKEDYKYQNFKYIISY